MANGSGRLKIAILIKSFVTSGGSQRYAVEVARRLLEKGHSIDLYTREVDESLTAGMTLYRVPERWMFSSAFALYSFATLASRMLASRRYDVIHTHERGPIPADIATLHSFCFRGAGYLDFSLWKRIVQVYLTPRSWLHLWLEKKMMAAANLVAVSDVIREDVRRHYKRDDRIAVITPGVDADFFHPAWIRENREEIRSRANISSRERVILFVGTEFRRKGLDLLLPAIPDGVRLVVVGRGENHEYYRKMVEKCGLAGRVDFVGLATDVRPYYAMADVVALPTRSEAFGMTVLEAMACGLVTVTHSGAGASSLIDDEKNGFLFSEPSELAGVLGRALGAAEDSATGTRARRNAEEHTWQSCADGYEALYRELASQSTRKI